MKKILLKTLSVIMVMAVCMQIALYPIITVNAQTEATVYVSLSGYDSGDGSVENPYKSIEKAKTAVRTMINGGDYSKITVILREGTYSVEDGLLFESLDSGNSSCSVEYTAFPGETAILTTSKAISGDNFEKVEDEEILSRIPESARNFVLQADLASLDIPYGKMIKNRYQTFGEASSPILYIDGQMQTLARWPNAGWAIQGEILDEGKSGNGSFVYKETDKTNWETATEAWYHGFGYHLWADESAKASFDTENSVINLDGELAYGLLEKRPYYIYNLLEELDAPGEWFLDRSTGIMYLYPQKDISEADIRYATSENSIVTIKNASYITFSDIIFEGTCRAGVSISNDSHHNLIKNCEFRNIGMVGVEIKKSSYENGISGCYMHDLCKSGVNITEESGDFTTLKHNNNYVENCHIENYGLTSYGYMAAIRAYGIGDRISHNRINGGKHLAIYLNGNDNVVEYNDIYNVMNTAEDMAAIYCWSDWTNLGHKIKYNIIHDMPGTKLPYRTHTAHAIYFDDSASNATIYGNVIANVEAGIYSNGGSYHDIQNNIFINNSQFATNIFNWSSQPDDMSIEANRVLMESIANGDEEWAGYQAYTYINHKYRQMYWQQKYPAGKAAYDAKYPWLATFLESDPFLPTHNTVKNNISSGDNDEVYGTAFRIGDIVVDRGTVDSNIEFPTGISLDEVHNVTDYSSILAAIPDFEELDITQTGPMGKTNLTVGDFEVKKPFKMDTADDEGKIMFSWNNASGADKYCLKIATDEEFNNVVFEEETNLDYMEVDNLDYVSEKYYWRVDARSTSHAYTTGATNVGGAKVLDYNSFELTQEEFKDVLENFAEEIDAEAGAVYKTLSEAEKAYVVNYVASNKNISWTDETSKKLFIQGVEKINEFKALIAMDEDDAKAAIETDFSKYGISPESYNEYSILNKDGKELAIKKFVEGLEDVTSPEGTDALFKTSVEAGKKVSKDEDDDDDKGGRPSPSRPSSSVSVSIQEKPSNPAKEELLEIPEEELLYKDMEKFQWADEAVHKLTKAGIINGMGEGIFAPQDTVTREQAVKMIVTGFGLTQSGAVTFDDVEDDAWYKEYISIAVGCGIVKGVSKTSFGVGIPVTRQDMMVMLKRAADYSSMNIYRVNDVSFTDSDSISSYAKDAVQTMANAGIVSGRGDGEFAPRANASRAETAVMCYRLFTKLSLM